MYSTLQRLNHLASISTTFVMILLGLISVASFYTLPKVDVGEVDVRDLIIGRGRLNRFRAKEEDLGQLKFDIKANLAPLLASYNTKQLYVYLTAAYVDAVSRDAHEVVLWDRIITRAESTDFRAVAPADRTKVPKVTRNARVRVEGAKSHYVWHNPSGSFKNIDHANITLHYSLMPYVGLLTSGIAATAHAPVEIVARR